MNTDLATKYPLATRAFAQQESFYARFVETGMPAEITKTRDRAAEIIDRYIDAPEGIKDALIVAAAVSLDPLPLHKIYGDETYGQDVERILSQLMQAAKNPENVLPPEIAPLVTSVAIAKMERMTEEIDSGRQQVTPATAKGNLHRAALNDAIYIPNLNSPALLYLYETTQFAYLTSLDRAALKPYKPPAKPPSGPVF